MHGPCWLVFVIVQILTSCLYLTQSPRVVFHMTAGWHQCKFRVISAGKAAATKVLIHLEDVTASYLQCCWLCLANDILNLIYPTETGMELFCLHQHSWNPTSICCCRIPTYLDNWCLTLTNTDDKIAYFLIDKCDFFKITWRTINLSK